MKTKITSDHVIGYTGNGHVVFRNGEVVYENDTILFAGHDYPHPVDETIHAGNAIVSPGFIDLDALGDIDHAILDMWVPPETWKGLEWSEDYFSHGRHELFSREDQAFNRRYAFVQLLLNGITTAMPIAGEYQKEWAETIDECIDMADIAADLGIRVYLGPSYRSGITVTRADGTSDVMWNHEKGSTGLDDAAEFIRKFDGAHNGLVKGYFAPCRIQTCTPDLLQRTLRLGKELDTRVRLHACQEPNEVRLMREWYGKTPLQFLYDIGFLCERTLVPHAVFIGKHNPVVKSDRDELELLALSGAAVVHCPLVEARAGATLVSFEKYRRAGVPVALGTDTFPPDMIRVMDYGMSVGRIVDGDKSSCQPGDFFNAATLGGARALGRTDLGRLSPGAKADIIIIGLDTLRTGTVDDPIRTLVYHTTGHNVKTVIVNGRIAMRDGRIPGVDCDALRVRGQTYFNRLKAAYPERDYLRRNADDLFPPTFPTFSRSGT
jgi:cytosine/adenosine deaminase-related metal-dependent hydrolase